MTPLITAATPERLQLAKNRGRAACLAYMTNSEGFLMRSDINCDVSGSIMLINGPVTDRASEQILGECRRFGYSGIAADNILNADRLIKSVISMGLALFLPEDHAMRFEQSFALISSAVSSGSFKKRFESAAARFGKKRIAAVLEPLQTKLSVPGGAEIALSDGEFLAVINSRGSKIFFSGDLCARYAVICTPGGISTVVFDDAQCLRRKAQLLRQMELGAMFAMIADDDITAT